MAIITDESAKEAVSDIETIKVATIDSTSVSAIIFSIATPAKVGIPVALSARDDKASVIATDIELFWTLVSNKEDIVSDIETEYMLPKAANGALEYGANPNIVSHH